MFRTHTNPDPRIASMTHLNWALHSSQRGREGFENKFRKVASQNKQIHKPITPEELMLVIYGLNIKKQQLP